MTEPERPIVEVLDADDARMAVDALVADLQEGWDTDDADVTDRRMAADVAWGSPFGATIGDFATLHAIHQRLKRAGTGGAASRFRVERVLPVAPDVVVAQVARLALDPHGAPLPPGDDIFGAFSEMAMYVLVRRDGRWWLAAAQNTPIRRGGAAPNATD